MAVGKPFVSFRFNSDYTDFEDLVFLSEDKYDFVEQVRKAFEKSGDSEIIHTGVKIAARQSADLRAKQFMEIVRDIK